jgi:nucleotide-binding universal stress UspA family protein
VTADKLFWAMPGSALRSVYSIRKRRSLGGKMGRRQLQVNVGGVMKNLLVPVDLSETSVAVVDRASCLAQSFGSRLWLLHVFPPTHGRVPYNLDRHHLRKEMAREIIGKRYKLRQLAARLRRDRVNVTTRSIAGNIPRIILNEAERINADLIVLGSHGHGNLYHALLGGVGQKVKRKATCPVMLVRMPSYYSVSQVNSCIS